MSESQLLFLLILLSIGLSIALWYAFKRRAPIRIKKVKKQEPVREEETWEPGWVGRGGPPIDAMRPVSVVDLKPKRGADGRESTSTPPQPQVPAFEPEAYVPEGPYSLLF